MKDELYYLLNRIWLEGEYNGDRMSFDEWLHEDDSREGWLIGELKKALED